MSPEIHSPRAAWMGWAGEAIAAEAWSLLSDQMPAFEIRAPSDSSAGRRLVLWDFTRRLAGGEHLPTHQQEIGDCVSMGAANAVDYLAAMEIVRLGERERLRPAYPPFLYGVSRVQIGKGRLGRRDGSTGAWAAAGVRRFGVLAADEPAVPAYSGRLARSWGASGPPEEFLERARPHVVRTTARVTDYEQIRDALANGYPVTVASSRGFRMRPVVDRGKAWGVPSGRWMHQMCLVGVDDDPRRPGCYCLNSWGAMAHGAPADDAPPGGFWIDAEVVSAMAGQGDSFAFSQFDGFPEQRLDFQTVG